MEKLYNRRALGEILGFHDDTIRYHEKKKSFGWPEPAYIVNGGGLYTESQVDLARKFFSMTPYNRVRNQMEQDKVKIEIESPKP